MPNDTHDEATLVMMQGGQPDYLVVESRNHFNWRLRFVLDTDQLLRHEFLFENTPEPSTARCLICNETNMNSFVHSKSRIVSAGSTFLHIKYI